MFFEVFIAGLALSLIKGVALFVSYINNNTFPPPLKKEEESKYLSIIEDYRQNSKNLREEAYQHARNKLIEHNLRLVAHLTKKYDNTKEDSEDLISIGTIGLIKGIDTYNPSKGTTLSTYSARCIQNEILMHLRTLKKSRGEISIHDPIGTDKEGNSINLIDVLGTEPNAITEQVENEFEQRAVLQKLKCLTTREKQVIMSRFGLLNKPQKTQREVGKLLGISRSYVSRIEDKAVKKLSKEMENYK